MLRTAPAILVLLLGLCLTASSAPPETVGIPLKPDPPIAVDGNLGDWERVPNARGISAPGPGHGGGPEGGGRPAPSGRGKSG